MKPFFLICLLIFANAHLFSQTVDCTVSLNNLLKSQKETISEEKKKEIIPCVYEIQNEGFYFDEKKCKYDSAKYKIESALKIWQHINDTLNQANLLKYLGYLNGRLGYFDSGKKQISGAINLYTIKKVEYGVAVSLFDLSKIYEFENKIDSAIFFSNKALNYWKQKNNSGRIVGINNNLINLFLKKKELQNSKSLIAKNNNYVVKDEIYWLQELDFYFISSQYFLKIKDKKNKKKYLTLYSDKISELEKIHGQKKFSLFDERNCR